MSRERVTLIVAAGVAIIGTLDSGLSLLDRLRGGLDLGAVLPFIRLFAGPVALLLVLWLLWGARGNSRQSWPRPPDRFLPAWASKDRPGHWNGVREMAIEVRAELAELVSQAGDGITVRDVVKMEARVESLEANIANYEETWSRGSTFWDPRNRERWDRVHRDRRDRPNHVWAVPLWERIEYAITWVYGHPPETERPPRYAGAADWGLGSDMGWS